MPNKKTLKHYLSSKCVKSENFLKSFCMVELFGKFVNLEPSTST